MILYFASKARFTEDVLSNQIDRKIEEAFLFRLGRTVGRGEIASWRNSLVLMNNLLGASSGIPNDVNVAIEYKIPNTSKRIDFLLAGQTHDGKGSIVIVELKQWEHVAKTGMDALVNTRVGGGERPTPHPSYQAWTYAALLSDFNSSVQDLDIKISPCAYLHNCTDGTTLRDPFYSAHLDKAPLFLRNDTRQLTEFIQKRVPRGDGNGVLHQIESGTLRPSKSLADSLVRMLKGNPEFLMIDDQKVVYETALNLSAASNAKHKNVLIVEGGPGSGKSVVAVNLLVELTRLGRTTQYVSKNAAPRAVYEQRLTGSFRKSHISNLFKGSGAYVETDRNSFDALVVDEAHRLNEKSGMYSNLGENQVKELIRSSLFTVFFLDESQRVTFKDIGTKEEIRKWAKSQGAWVTELTLSSQFRCSGSDSFLAWLDSVLQIRETANESPAGTGHDVQVVDDPAKLKTEILALNKKRNSARMVAGYCWEWKSKKNPAAYDIKLGDGFNMKWNLTEDGSAWIIQPDSVQQVGCIHTCQGLEVDYIGVIIGPDLIVRNGKVITDGTKRARSDQSIKGLKARLKSEPEVAKRDADQIIKNTYRTLLSRGMKGCRIYATDEETREYFKRNLRLPTA